MPWVQARRLADALTDAGAQVELIIDDDMGHELDPQYLSVITDFFNQHLR